MLVLKIDGTVTEKRIENPHEMFDLYCVVLENYQIEIHAVMVKELKGSLKVADLEMSYHERATDGEKYEACDMWMTLLEADAKAISAFEQVASIKIFEALTADE